MADRGAVSLLVAALAAVAAAAALQFFYKMYRTRTRLASLVCAPTLLFVWTMLKLTRCLVAGTAAQLPLGPSQGHGRDCGDFPAQYAPAIIHDGHCSEV